MKNYFWNLFFPKAELTKELNDSYFETISDLKKIFDIFNEIYTSNKSLIEIDLTNCTHLSLTGVTMLASLGPLCPEKNIKITTNNSTIEEYFENISPSIKKKHIPFKLFKNEPTSKKILEELKDIPEINKLDEEIYFEIYSKLYELCSNSLEHGKNSIGTVCNGMYDQGYLIFSVFDFGVGIFESVNSAKNNSFSNAKDAIEWALSDYNSSKQSSDTPRGIGFSNIINFVNKYNGHLIICTSNQYCIIKGNKKHFSELKASIPGTLITVVIKLK